MVTSKVEILMVKIKHIIIILPRTSEKSFLVTENSIYTFEQVKQVGGVNHLYFLNYLCL